MKEKNTPLLQYKRRLEKHCFETWSQIASDKVTVLSNCSRFGGVHGSPLSRKAGHCSSVWVEVVRHSQRVWAVPGKERILRGPGKQTCPQYWLLSKIPVTEKQNKILKNSKLLLKKQSILKLKPRIWASLNPQIRNILLKINKAFKTESWYWTLTPPPPKKRP